MMDLDAEARRLLELTREARTPSARDKERIETLLGAGVGFAVTTAAGRAVHASQAPAAKVAGSTLALKWIAGAALVAALGAASYGGLRAAQQPIQHAMTTHASAAVVAKTSQPAVVDNRAPVEPAPLPEVAAQPPPRVAEGARRIERHATLGPELDLLHEVQLKWRSGDAPEALTLLAQHRERYPRSQLAPEREALRVLCLCAAGRTDEARRIARRFLAKTPQSPLRTSVEESCAGR